MRGRKDDPNEIKFIETIKMLAPGTVLRDALEYIVAAGTGALIVIGDDEEVMKVKDGGFRIDRQVIPSHLYELTKMDGAIILSKDAGKILFANVTLQPGTNIYTSESGTRHRAAERISKQTGVVTIAVSQRRSSVTIYVNRIKYVLKDPVTLIAKATLALQTLDKFQQVFLKVMKDLTVQEFHDSVTISDVALAIQRGEMIHRICGEVNRFVMELGKEGRLIAMQLNELLIDMNEEMLLIKDYYKRRKNVNPESIHQEITELSKSGKLNINTISNVLGFGYVTEKTGLKTITPRGYRLLNKLPNLPQPVIEQIVSNFGDFKRIMSADIKEMGTVPGIAEVRSSNIVNGLNRLKEKYLLEQ